ncbi:RNA polymerase sigma factor [Paludisphaera mucosa]|uniref:Sigma-70 family RNA polymerase sigma factor n=1 Tax=Paludisphaera mucosa TaxID=3030827 RepID=A0ABT6FC20_9BACT|nr:sigma-70 family RNA polymerase sigma factor [Paludisphaera mucosa]MDG3005133.1 sigma-70 family RNA polymerase sigma factor [Paludisphaera mucosa]
MTPDPRSLRDEILVLKHRLGDASAFDELMRRWEPRLLYYLRRLVPQEADAWDALQRTWLAAFRDLSRLEEPKALRAWLYRVARNQAASHLRAESARRGSVEDVDPDDLVDTSWTPDPDDAEAVHAALAILSLPHREVVALHFLEQMPLREIAEVVGAPVGTIKSRLHHARRLLRRALESHEPEGGRIHEPR